MADMEVDLVAPERMLWSGRASFVSAQTTEGQIGIYSGHEPVLGQLAEGGIVTIVPTEGEKIVAAVHGGFFATTGNSVRVLAEAADLSGEVDLDEAKKIIADADSSPEAILIAQGQVRAAEKSVTA